METLICFIVAGSLVCEVKPLDRERGDFEPIEITKSDRLPTWPPSADMRVTCYEPGRCSVYPPDPLGKAPPPAPLWQFSTNDSKPKPFNYRGDASLYSLGR